jgi:hypothetical protein
MDHEVYFLSLPEAIKRRELTGYMVDKLHELHPGFSAASAYDLQKVNVNGRPWMMATVMESEKLTEYRLSYPRAFLFTATGVLVYRHDFCRRGMAVFTGETIGYDAGKDEPVSIPAPGIRTETAPAREIRELLQKTPSRYRVFKKPLPRFLRVLPLVPALAVLAVLLTRYISLTPQPVRVPPVPEPAAVKQDMPSPLAILAEIADAVKNAKGTIVHWQYNESAEPALTLQLAGLEADKFYGVMKPLTYVSLREISEIRYQEGIPHYTARISLNALTYRIPPGRNFTTQEEALLILAALREQLSPGRVQIIAESPPSADSGDDTCAVTLEADGRDFIQTLDVIDAACEARELRIRNLLVSLDRDRGMFLFFFSFAPFEKEGTIPVLLDDRKTSIPVAFGYTGRKTVTPQRPVMLPVWKEESPEEAPVEEAEEMAYMRIGIIKEKTTTVYYKTQEGKIIMVGE